uniref:Uncharacterized protein n=1 Tax=Acrobeloides nanus TaxID=290746 RepID=A0A914D514_9BILA
MPKYNHYILNHLIDYGGAMTMDFITKDSHFFVSTVHFIDSTWTLKHGVMDFHDYTPELSTSVEVREDFEKSMKSHNLWPDILKQRLYYNTDRGSNLIRALDGYYRFDDPCHQMNLLSLHLTNPYSDRFLPEEFRISDEDKKVLFEIDMIIENGFKIINGVNARITLKKKVKSLGPAIKKPKKLDG